MRPVVGGRERIRRWGETRQSRGLCGRSGQSKGPVKRCREDGPGIRGAGKYNRSGVVRQGLVFRIEGGHGKAQGPAQVTVTHDGWIEDDPGYASCADGWPRILSRLKTLIETGKTFKPH